MNGSGWTISKDDLWLRRGAQRALLLGGQVHNSSSSSPASIQASFAHVRRMNGNTVLAPVSWAITEPQEGVFDFSLVDEMVRVAGELGLRLVPLWFGAFKNASSTYAPRWVRADEQRFARAVTEATLPAHAFHHQGATPAPVLSVFSEAVRDADAAAFTAFLTHIAEIDSAARVVAMVQVENESGLLRDSRDRGTLATEAWRLPVPAPLITLARGAEAGSFLGGLWSAAGEKAEGSWAEVFGDGTGADEVFMAWAFARYVEHLAQSGDAAGIPLYTNAWLGPQPGQDQPGQWPSGGPSSRVIDVWRTAAPSLALVAPDIYVDDADAVMRTYATGTQPLFVPESRIRAGELVRAIGAYRAIGWSAFGIDGANPDGQTAATLGFLTACERGITAAQDSGRIGALVVEPGEGVVETRIGDVTVSGRSLNDLVRNFLLDVGVQLPEESLPVPDETLPNEAVPTPGEHRPFVLVFAEDENTLVVIGQGVKIDYALEQGRVEIDEVHELLLRDGELIPGRVLNGDERLQVVPVERVGAARVTLLRLP